MECLKHKENTYTAVVHIKSDGLFPCARLHVSESVGQVVVNHACVGFWALILVTLWLNLQDGKRNLASFAYLDVDVQVELTSQFPAQLHQLNY